MKTSNLILGVTAVAGFFTVGISDLVAAEWYERLEPNTVATALPASYNVNKNVQDVQGDAKLESGVTAKVSDEMLRQEVLINAQAAVAYAVINTSGIQQRVMGDTSDSIPTIPRSGPPPSKK